MKRVRALMMGLAMSAAVQVCAADALTEALQKGLFEEEANQNLEAAIKAYQDVLSRAEEQRRVAATALFRLAECYRKQGKTNEATVEYRRLVRDYSEQATLVNLSRQNLVGLGANTPVASATQTQSTDPLTTDEEQQEIQRIRALIKNSPDLINAKDRMFQPDSSGNSAAGTLLHGAAAKGHLLVAEYLLANGADVNALDPKYSQTPLYYAAQSGHKRVAELLLAKGAQPSPAEGGQPLHIAVERGFKGVVEVLLSHKADVNAKAPYRRGSGPPDPNGGMTALHVAIKQKNLHIAELLIERGANVNARFDFPRDANSARPPAHLEIFDGTPLHFAVQRAESAMVKLLLAKGAAVNAPTSDGVTPLHYTAYQNKNAGATIATILLDHKADVNARPSEGTRLAGLTPLHLAVVSDDTNLAGLFLEKGADPNLPAEYAGALELRSALHTAIARGSPRLVEMLLKYKANPNGPDFHGTTPLWRATVAGHERIVELLLAHDAAIEAIGSEGNVPLVAAVQAGNLSMAELLLSKGANPNATNSDGFPLLHVALGAQPPSAPGQPLPTRTSRPRPQVFAPQPLRSGELPPGTSPAERKPDKTMVQLLLEHKGDPNQLDHVRDKVSETALHLAARNGNQSAVELLLEHRADPNARASSGSTPLHWAANNETLIDILLAHKADPNATDAEGQTPLHRAANSADTNTVARLVKAGADINACTRSGDTPLRMLLRTRSIREKEFTAIQFFLNLGADVTKSCDGNSSALEVALGQKASGLVDLFRKHHSKKLAVVTFEGPAAKPGWFWEADKTVTLSEAIAAVGLQETADPRRITIWRNNPDTGLTVSERHNLVFIREKFDGVKDPPLKHGDKITVAVRAD